MLFNEWIYESYHETLQFATAFILVGDAFSWKVLILEINDPILQSCIVMKRPKARQARQWATALA